MPKLIYSNLIKLVHNHPELWQSSHPQFKNQSFVWLKLAINLGVQEPVLRKAWNSIVNQYHNELNKKNTMKALGINYESTWEHYKDLAFLDETIDLTKSIGTKRKSSEIPDDGAQDTEQPNKRVTKADYIVRKLQNIEVKLDTSQIVVQNDEDHMFFMSILPMVKTLSPVKKLQLRGKINSWLIEALSNTDPLDEVGQFEMIPEGDSDPEDNKDDVFQIQ